MAELRHDHARAGRQGDRAAARHQAVGVLLAPRRESYVFDYVKDQLIKEYGAATVRGGGLKVYTTIDLKLQQEARACDRRPTSAASARRRRS